MIIIEEHREPFRFSFFNSVVGIDVCRGLTLHVQGAYIYLLGPVKLPECTVVRIGGEVT